MDAFKFILKYPEYISELKEIVKSELISQALKCI